MGDEPSKLRTVSLHMAMTYLIHHGCLPEVADHGTGYKAIAEGSVYEAFSRRSYVYVKTTLLEGRAVMSVLRFRHAE